MSSTPDTHDAADPGLQSQAWARLLERLLRGLESGSRQWPIGRRKESVARVLHTNRQDMVRLRQRLEPLVTAWETERGSSGAAVSASGSPAVAAARSPSNFVAP